MADKSDALNVDRTIELIKEVARHRKRVTIVLNYDGEGNFIPIFEKIKLSVEEYTSLSGRR